MTDKFRVHITKGLWKDPWPKYFQNFWDHCMEKGTSNNYLTITVANWELKPLGGRLIQTKTQGWYLRWDKESSHTAFVLKWS